MSEPTRGFHSSLSSPSSLLQRIRENLHSLRAASRIRIGTPLTANSVPIHLLENPPYGRLPAQASSMALHVLGFAAVLALIAHPAVRKVANQIPMPQIFPKLNYSPSPSPNSDANRLGKSGNSGDHNPLPPSNGELPPTSRIVFASPRPIDNPYPKLPVTTAIFAADAPDFTPPVTNPGLPWAPDKNNSGGPGKNGIGRGEQHGAGGTPGDGVGVGHDVVPYSVAATPVACKYCPDPQYSDEARQTKLQGHVTLHVLVGADGRAKELRIAQGLGMGLDENAVDAVRHWQFIPARDAAHRPIASWITIETVFRLF
jgi:protein TonB